MSQRAPVDDESCGDAFAGFARSRSARRICVAIFACAAAGLGGRAAPGIESAPFAPRSRPAGATLFTRLSAEQTGITCTNNYADPEMWGKRYEVFALGSTGTGVAVGDYDGDGLPDIYVVNKSDGNRLYRNLGGFRFEDVTERAGLREPTDAWKQAAAWADVNNDGRLDLYVSRIGAPNLLYINQGDGTFREEAAQRGVALVDASGMADFCDYDRDGWLDFYLQTNLLDYEKHPQGQRDHLFHNRGDGTFEEVTDKAGVYGETHGHSATWWDYDNDGWPDLYVANDFSQPDQLYHNNRDGTFTDALSAAIPHMPFFAMGSDLGDLNNDGLIDFVVADMAATTHAKDKRTMIEMRKMLPELPDASWATQIVRSAVYLNTGTGRCLEAACLAGISATDWTWSVRLEDLDNDGWLDVHVTNGMIRDFFDADLHRRVMELPPKERARAVKAMPVLNEKHLVYRNRGDLQFEEVGAAWGLDQTGVSFGAAFADFDGDGDLDLVYVNYLEAPTVCRNDSDGHRITVALRGTKSNRFGIGALVRIETADGPQVRSLLPARGYMSSSEPIVHFGLGAQETIRRLTVTWPGGAVQSFENLAADRRYTITEPAGDVPAPAAASAESGPRGQFEDVSAALGLALTTTDNKLSELKEQPLLPFRQNPFGPGVAIGDLDGDGHDDIVVGGVTGRAAQMAVATEPGVYRSTLISPRTTDPADAALLLFDADGDGHDDLLLTKGGTAKPAGDPGYQPVLVLSRGGGKYRQAPPGSLPPFTSSAGPCVAADFDHDGRLDVFIGGRVVPGAYGATPRSALWLNRGGRFTDETEALAPGLAHAGMISGALATDVDQDGWVDLLIAPQWGRVQCWHNAQGKGFEDWSGRLGFAGAGDGWWNSIAAADFNGDGRLDYVVGNAGLNTPYQASPEEPALLFRGDFDASGREQPIEALVDDGRIVPRRGRSTLLQVLPGIARTAPTYAAYSTASLAEILGEEPLRRAVKLQVTELRSGVFLSQPDGTYRFEPLPRIAQIAPIYGIVAGDFDGDGKADLCAVQNSFAPIAEVGRFDGGLGQFLRGDGRGGFVALTPRASGLIVPGDGKGLARIDLDGDGWPDLVATRNNSATLALRNAGGRGGAMFAVLLEGPAGNPHAVGARIEVTMGDGRRQVAEVAAGGGYLSQSAAACFFGYEPANPPTEIAVAWPTGERSRHRWAAGTVVYRLSPR